MDFYQIINKEMAPKVFATKENDTHKFQKKKRRFAMSKMITLVDMEILGKLKQERRKEQKAKSNIHLFC